MPPVATKVRNKPSINSFTSSRKCVRLFITDQPLRISSILMMGRKSFSRRLIGSMSSKSSLHHISSESSVRHYSNESKYFPAATNPSHSSKPASPKDSPSLLKSPEQTRLSTVNAKSLPKMTGLQQTTQKHLLLFLSASVCVNAHWYREPDLNRHVLEDTRF